MSKKKCNTIELKKLGDFGILSSLDGDSMAERDYSKEYAREKEQQKKVFAKITPKQYEDFTKATEKNCTCLLYTSGRKSSGQAVLRRKAQ